MKVAPVGAKRGRDPLLTEEEEAKLLQAFLAVAATVRCGDTARPRRHDQTSWRPPVLSGAVPSYDDARVSAL